MRDLPKPMFASDKDIERGAAALSKAGDTTKENIERAVSLGELVLDGDYVYVRQLQKEGNLLYHVFRGKEIPDKFWGQGEFGLVLLSVSEMYWPTDKPKVEFHAETCRPEVYEDDPKGPPQFPPCFYGAYLVVVPGVDRKLFLPKKKIEGMARELSLEVKKSVESWSNGG